MRKTNKMKVKHCKINNWKIEDEEEQTPTNEKIMEIIMNSEKEKLMMD